MLVNAYLNVTPKQWEEIKEKYVETNMYHIVSNSKRKNKRCDECGLIVLAVLMRDIVVMKNVLLTETTLVKIGMDAN